MSKFYPTTLANCKKSALAFIAVLFCLMMNVEKGFGQTTQTFNYTGATQTFTIPNGTYAIYVECYGGGGGGSTITSNGKRGGGGGGGAYAASVIYVTPGAQYSIVVGAGGVANTAGGTSTFNGTTVKAVGGGGAAGNSTTGANGGSAAACTGTILYSGGDAGDGDVTSNYSGGGGGGAGSTGAGGSTTNATAGVGTAISGGNGGAGVRNSNDGNSGNTYGGGGSGACTNTGTDRNGGSGANGLVKITYAIPYVAQFTALNTGAATWCAGETRNVTITVTNVGTATWTSSTGNKVNFSYWWTPGQTRDFTRLFPFVSLAPGASQVVTASVTALTAGNYILNFDLVKEGACWFADNVSGCSGPGNAIFTSPSITVNALPGAPTGTTPPSFCASASPTVANLTATGTTIKWYAAASGGSALVSTTPLVNGTHYYASQTNASGCESSARLDVTATLTLAPATVVYSTNPATYCAGLAIAANSPTTTSGGTPTGYTVSPALPAGLTLNAGTGVISGNPTTTAGVATAIYTVTASNSCGSTTVGVSITISPAAPAGLTYPTISTPY